MRLDPLSLGIDDEDPLPSEIEHLILEGESVIQTFWDRWHSQPIEQYVACDFRLVAHAIRRIIDEKLLDGTTFCEWGCGFGIITGIASICGLEAVGIEAEPFLVEGAKRLLFEQNVRAEIWQGNFLPAGATSLADHQARHASLFHQVPIAYDQHDLQLDDFALVFAYPWPGEQFFLMEVFRKYARIGAVLLMFLGPYQIELYRKIGSAHSFRKHAT